MNILMKKLPPVILASKSPRRQQLLKLMDVDFKVILKEVDESYPDGLGPAEIAVYIAEKKAKAFDEAINNEIVITADTIVCVEEKILGKPDNEEHAFEILSQISGRKHDVITGVSLLADHNLNSFYEISEVYFRELKPEEIRYYIQTSKPFDKAGAYGIQEWIGLVGIEKIVGSYTNVVGLPTERLYRELERYCGL
jgi:septum formation protein